MCGHMSLFEAPSGHTGQEIPILWAIQEREQYNDKEKLFKLNFQNISRQPKSSLPNNNQIVHNLVQYSLLP